MQKCALILLHTWRIFNTLNLALLFVHPQTYTTCPTLLAASSASVPCTLVLLQACCTPHSQLAPWHSNYYEIVTKIVWHNKATALHNCKILQILRNKAIWLAILHHAPATSTDVRAHTCCTNALQKINK